MTTIQDWVLTFCSTMLSVQQWKLKLLMPIFNAECLHSFIPTVSADHGNSILVFQCICHCHQL